MTFAILPPVLSSAVKNPVSNITAIHVGCGITQLRVIVSTGNETLIFFLTIFICTVHCRSQYIFFLFITAGLFMPLQHTKMPQGLFFVLLVLTLWCLEFFFFKNNNIFLRQFFLWSVMSEIRSKLLKTTTAFATWKRTLLFTSITFWHFCSGMGTNQNFEVWPTCASFHLPFFTFSFFSFLPFCCSCWPSSHFSMYFKLN